MADAVTSQVLYDGPNKVVMKFTNVSDGTGESAVTKVDVSALTPAADEVAIERIIASTAGMSVHILWDADTDVLAFLVPTDAFLDVDLKELEGRGIINNAGAGKTGDVKFTTVGHTSGDVYTVILELRKRTA